VIDTTRTKALEAIEFVRSRISAQSNIPTAHNNAVLAVSDAILECDEPTLRLNLDSELDRLMSACLDASRARYWTFADRLQKMGGRRDVCTQSYFCGQGVQGPLQWRGRHLFKNVWDLAIYQQLLGDLQPATIVELGSGTGASALWFNDMIAMLTPTPTKILSFDIKPPSLAHDHIVFLHVDLSEDLSPIRQLVPVDLPRPWLIIEDAHVNTLEILQFFDDLVMPGDYIVVEDSLSKQLSLARFAESRNDSYLIDGKYVDMFGINATSAMNSIFVRK